MKETQRKTCRAVRASLSRDAVENNSREACAYFLNSALYRNSKVIMLYMPLGKETDTRMVIAAAYRDGKTVCFPVTDETGGIVAYAAEKDTVFSEGNFRVAEPQDTKPMDKRQIDLVLVPGIGFDKKGGRIGFGKGCYDRFLQDMTAVKIGFCHAEQIIEKVDTDTNDIRMDYIITQKGVTDCKRE